MEEKKQCFLIIPEELFTPELTSTDRIVFGQILLYSRIKGFCWASNETLARETYLSLNTVKRSIRKLKKLQFLKSYLTSKKGDKFSAWERKLTISFSSITDKTQAVNNLSRGGQTEPLLAQEGAKIDARGGQNWPIYNNTKNNTYKNNYTQVSSRRDTTVFKASKSDRELVKKMRPK